VTDLLDNGSLLFSIASLELIVRGRTTGTQSLTSNHRTKSALGNFGTMTTFCAFPRNKYNTQPLIFDMSELLSDPYQ
jgi:hypothetical protein